MFVKGECFDLAGHSYMIVAVTDKEIAAAHTGDGVWSIIHFNLDGTHPSGVETARLLPNAYEPSFDPVTKSFKITDRSTRKSACFGQGGRVHRDMCLSLLIRGKMLPSDLDWENTNPPLTYSVLTVHNQYWVVCRLGYIVYYSVEGAKEAVDRLKSGLTVPAEWRFWLDLPERKLPDGSYSIEIDGKSYTFPTLVAKMEFVRNPLDNIGKLATKHPVPASILRHMVLNRIAVRRADDHPDDVGYFTHFDGKYAKVLFQGKFYNAGEVAEVFVFAKSGRAVAK